MSNSTYIHILEALIRTQNALMETTQLTLDALLKAEGVEDDTVLVDTLSTSLADPPIASVMAVVDVIEPLQEGDSVTNRDSKRPTAFYPAMTSKIFIDYLEKKASTARSQIEKEKVRALAEAGLKQGFITAEVAQTVIDGLLLIT